MEGIYFYWFAWMGWIFTTFLMKKTKQRLLYTAIILCSIMLSVINVQLLDMEVNSAFLFLLIISYMSFSIVKAKKQVYYFIASFIGALAYASFCLFELYDPVWILIDKRVMVSALILYVIFMLVKTYRMRIICSVISICQGDLFFSFVLRTLSFPYEIGAPSLLDIVAVTVLCISVWEGVLKATAYFDVYLLKWNKQKQTTYK
ncbi:hypothetical protein [Metabacillus iocasae]|uniref:Cellulose synthase/poly-beta-1,6-N-acetylglucosamine synthase-like glycosyltransferase n=1 Tax=Priestia iocasae TaxID=2291674 RepID=A0ABS2QQI7_9BACI|nr:hypothetical protein [Metabacillus iocasae]MBM7701709.1 cellulose synthase/poly-beta-1,6-N-acetylglucosamine synthase-like glycosyltransferase [Metabacillus iocasae]